MILRGPSHVIDYQSDLFIRLDGNQEGVPYIEAFCSETSAGYRSILDDVYATGIEMEVTTPYGVLWAFRLADESGVALHYDRVRPVPEYEPGASQLALAG